MEKHGRKLRKPKAPISRSRTANGNAKDKEKREKKIRTREKKRGTGVNIWSWRARHVKVKKERLRKKEKRTEEDSSDELSSHGTRLSSLAPCFSMLSPCLSQFQYRPIISRITTMFSTRNGGTHLSSSPSMRSTGRVSSNISYEAQSSAEERQSAIQGAISHCKNSWRQSNKEDDSLVVGSSTSFLV